MHVSGLVCWRTGESFPRATVCVCVCVCVRWAYSADNQRQFGCWISGWSVALCAMYNLKYIAIGQTKRVVFICNNLFFSDSVCWIHRQPDQSLAGDHRNPIKMYISKNRMQNMKNWIIIKKDNKIKLIVLVSIFLLYWCQFVLHQFTTQLFFWLFFI